MKIQLKPDHNYDSSDAEAQPEAKPEAAKRISLIRIAILLSLSAIGVAVVLSIQFLIAPLSSIFWSESKKSLSLAADGIYPPQTLAEIEAELAKAKLKLGTLLPVGSGDRVYAITKNNSKEIREIRVYQALTVSDSNIFGLEVNLGESPQTKLRLFKKIEIGGLDEYFVRAPGLKFKPQSRDLKDLGQRLPVTELKLIAGDVPSQGFWFMAMGKNVNISYGRIFCYVNQPQPALNALADWASPAGQQPEWHSDLTEFAPPLTAISQSQPQSANSASILLIDRTQSFEPDFLIYRLEKTLIPTNPLQLRRITLNETLKMPRSYNDALLLASNGLWSPAAAKLQALQQQMQAKGQNFSSFVQEQYGLIEFHAKITAAQSQRPLANAGQQALMLIVDGRWQEAIQIAETSSSSARSVAEMLKTNQAHIWPRVMAVLKSQPSSDLKVAQIVQVVKVWGALVVLQRQGLLEAEQWLEAQKALNPKAIALLQQLDLTPLVIVPEQLIGTTSFLGKGFPGTRWQTPPPELLPGQAWYVVDISVIRDHATWINGPFPELAGRSPSLVWETLRLDRDRSLVASIQSDDGIKETLSLTTRSLFVSGDGSLQLLATGPDIPGDIWTKALNASRSASSKRGLPPLVATDNLPSSNYYGSTIYIQMLEPAIAEKIGKALYAELQTLGYVSLQPDEFSRQLASWAFQAIDNPGSSGSNNSDLLLELDRTQIDAGDRRYPMVAAFSSNGELLFSDIGPNTARQWVALLPGGNRSQVLIEKGGRYEVWTLR